jgi:hypothetical protein
MMRASRNSGSRRVPVPDAGWFFRDVAELIAIGAACTDGHAIHRAQIGLLLPSSWGQPCNPNE